MSDQLVLALEQMSYVTSNSASPVKGKQKFSAQEL